MRVYLKKCKLFIINIFRYYFCRYKFAVFDPSNAWYIERKLKVYKNYQKYSYEFIKSYKKDEQYITVYYFKRYN